MKRNRVWMVVLMVLVVSMFTACQNNESSKAGSTEEELENISIDSDIDVVKTEELKKLLNDKDVVVVDARSTNAFIGWKMDEMERGGHIKGATDFSVEWLQADNEKKESLLDEAMVDKDITPEKTVIVYDSNGKDAKEVATYLRGKGIEKIRFYDLKEGEKDRTLEMEEYPNYQKLVPVSVVKEILDGNKPESFENASTIKIFEASWGEEKDSYEKGHVPTSVHINTDWIEPPPAWMLGDAQTLTDVAKKLGIQKTDTIVLASEDVLPAYRVAIVLEYLGVEDVRVMHGGLAAWKNAGYELETKSNSAISQAEFGGKIPMNPEKIITQDQLKKLLNTSDFQLVDNRTWEEYIGKESGYSYHKIAGRIPKAIYGYAGRSGEGSSSVSYYRNVDNTMRNAREIKSLWEKQNIDLNKEIAFMCGSGWRAAEVLFYSEVMGMDNTKLYSDGWIGWSNNNNPSETGEPEKQ